MTAEEYMEECRVWLMISCDWLEERGKEDVSEVFLRKVPTGIDVDLEWVRQRMHIPSMVRACMAYVMEALSQFSEGIPLAREGYHLYVELSKRLEMPVYFEMYLPKEVTDERSEKVLRTLRS